MIILEQFYPSLSLSLSFTHMNPSFPSIFFFYPLYHALNSNGETLPYSLLFLHPLSLSHYLLQPSLTLLRSPFSPFFFFPSILRRHMNSHHVSPSLLLALNTDKNNDLALPSLIVGFLSPANNCNVYVKH